MLHVNKGGTSCSVKSTFCCEQLSVVKFILEVCVSVNLTCQVNTAQSNTLVHNIMATNERNWAQKYSGISEIYQFSCWHILFSSPCSNNILGNRS